MASISQRAIERIFLYEIIMAARGLLRRLLHEFFVLKKA